jgi:hypothetical protein
LRTTRSIGLETLAEEVGHVYAPVFIAFPEVRFIGRVQKFRIEQEGAIAPMGNALAAGVVLLEKFIDRLFLGVVFVETPRKRRRYVIYDEPAGLGIEVGLVGR